MAGSTLASPTASAAAARASAAASEARAGSETWRRFRRHRLAVASAVILALMLLAVAFGPLLWRVPINDIDFSAHLDGPSWSHPFGTDDLGQDLLARMLYGGRISLAVGLAAMLVAIVVGTAIGAIAGMSHRRCRCGADVAHRPVPVAAAVAVAAADHLLVSRTPEAAGRARARRLHPDRRGDRRLPLDAGGAAGARAVPVAAREGVRRGGARARA